MSYLEQCVDTVSSIDPDRLSNLPIGELLGCGSGFDAHSLGSMVIGGEILHIGLKVPTIFRHRVGARVRSDIALTTVLTNRVPSLKPMMPAFVGILAIDGQSRSVITEDASMGGQHGVELQAPLPDDIKSELFDAFAWAGGPNEVFDIHTLRRTTAFSVNGEVKILDLTPPPFKNQFRKWPEYRKAFYAVDDRFEDLIVKVGSSGVLAASINALGE